jgi:hypothetical protein
VITLRGFLGSWGLDIDSPIRLPVMGEFLSTPHI